MRRFLLWLWAALGNIFLAKDVVMWIVGPTVLATVAPPIAVWLFTPASPAGLIFVAVVCGSIALTVSIWRAKPKHVHHRDASVEARSEVGMQVSVQRAAEPGPDWPIRGLFFHIKPDILDLKSQDDFARVGDQILDKLSTGQLLAWGRMISGARALPLSPIPPAYWQHAILNPWLLDKEENGGNVLQANPRERARTKMQYAEIQINRAQALSLWPASAARQDNEISVQDAMMYIVNRRWPGSKDRLSEHQNNEASAALQDLRTAANKGRLKILGIEHNGQLPVAIPPDFWVLNQIDFMRAVFSDDLENICTEPATYKQTNRSFKNLKVIRSEVEALWGEGSP